MNTYIWIKPQYTQTKVRELVRIIYNPYKQPAKQVMKEWILPKYQHQCYAITQK